MICLQADIESETSKGTLPRIPAYMFDDTGERDRLGPSPILSDIMTVVEDAEHCVRTGQTEDGWNALVHHPLLRLSLHGGRRRGPSLLDSRLW